MKVMGTSKEIYNKILEWFKEWYITCNPYDARLFDTERYAKELHKVTDDNRWYFDKANDTP